MDIDMTALRALVREKEVSFEVVVAALEAALLTAYHHTEGAQPHARVELDGKTGHVTVWAREAAGEDGIEAREFGAVGRQPRGQLARRGEPLVESRDPRRDRRSVVEQGPGVLDDAPDHRSDVGAVVADEHDQEAVFTLTVVAGPDLTIHAGEGKVGGGQAEVAYRGFERDHWDLQSSRRGGSKTGSW